MIHDKVISPNLYGILQLAWRCANADRTKAMIEGTQPNPEKAYKRMVSLLMSRLRAEGKRWVRWIEVGRLQTPRHEIPTRGRDKGVMSIGGDSGRDPVYEIARPILQEARSLELLPAEDDDD